MTKQLAQFTSIDVALSVGGLDLKTQESMLRKNPDIVIATPGRLIDHIKNTPTFSLESIEVLILDEAGNLTIIISQYIYRVFIKYCVFSLQFFDFSELCQFCCSAGACTHTAIERKQRKAKVRNI